jgi:nucleotide-binding universal stress UspA family protein
MAVKRWKEAIVMITKILCPTDFSEGSLEAISFASDFAMHAGAEIDLLHVIPIVPALVTDPNFTLPTPEMERSVSTEVQAGLKSIAEPLVAEGLPVRKLIAHGNTATEIVRIADREQVDVIVIATYGRTGWRRLVLGSVAEKVVRLAACPVVTFRARPRPAEDGKVLKHQQVAS